MSKNRARGDKKRGKPRGREAPLPQFVQEALKEQRNAFRQKFGREPADGDPVFFDPDANTAVEISSVRMEAGLLEAMRRAGTPPQVIYAFKKTGLLGTERDLRRWPAARRREYKAAIADYFKLAEAATDVDRPDPAKWHSEIPELEVCPISQQDFDQVTECLRLIAKVQGAGMTVAARSELAAVLLADACASAYASAEARGKPEDGPRRYDGFEELVINRAREIYAQGQV